MAYSGIGKSSSIGKHIWIYPVIERALRLSGLKSGDKTVILTDVNRSQSIFDAFYAAAGNICNGVFAVVQRPLSGAHDEKSREPDGVILELLKQCDFIVDLPTTHWCYTRAYNEVLDAGVKVLLSCSDEELLHRLAPDEAVIRRTRKAANLLTQGKMLRITSALGTELTMSVDGRVGNAQCGAIGEGYRWDNFPSGLTEIAPIETSLHGRLVIAPGDLIIELERRIAEPISCTIENGEIVAIEGGVDARNLRAWFDQWDDRAVRTVAHTGFGTDPRATLFSSEAMDWESYDGGINLAFGANCSRFLGGRNMARAHIDIILLNCDFYVDQTRLVRAGKTLLID
ncbi:hypothetical protein [Sinorhizobium sp. BJ1]|uniref:hypothetical protein n=1 Tax=Sinorhizobium sp. BJ1 TaxID=2035455 RepID=UPI000BE955A3|nr:hypothetical protein [Sinorhizobium sp. BJ1]PDT78026.1 hypothetical protein CO676_33040 [Sinorhizobium sp. BJ1]